MIATNNIGMHVSVGITVLSTARKAFTSVDYKITLLLCQVAFTLFQGGHVKCYKGLMCIAGGGRGRYK